MQGTVRGENKRIQRYAIETDLGYTIADLVDGALQTGDIVTGALNDHGDAHLQNHTQGTRCHVYIEAIQASIASAESLLRNK